MSDYPPHGSIAEVHERIRQALRNVTLAELFRPGPDGEGARHGLELATLEG